VCVIDLVVVPRIIKKTQESGKDEASSVIFTKCSTKGLNKSSIAILVYAKNPRRLVSGTIIRGTLKTPNSQLVTPISIKLLRPDGCD
jgi:hypothetical protein